MVRCILTAAALLVAGAAHARIFVDNPETVATLADARPGDMMDVHFSVRLGQFHGSFADGTAHVTGRLWNPEFPAFDLPLSSDAQWIFEIKYLLGVSRNSDRVEAETEECGGIQGHEQQPGAQCEINDIDINELNLVRNYFGAGARHFGADVTYDDVVNIDDLNAVRNMFGAPNWYSWDGETFRTGRGPRDVIPGCTEIRGHDCTFPINAPTVPTPEPTAAMLLALGLFGLSMRRGNRSVRPLR